MWKDIVADLVPVVVSIAVPILLLLARAFMKWLEKKLDFDISTANEAKIEGIIFDAIAYAEEQALKALKSGTQMGSKSKLELAIEYVLNRVKELGLPEMATASIVKLLESKLNMTRPVAPAVVTAPVEK